MELLINNSIDMMIFNDGLETFRNTKSQLDILGMERTKQYMLNNFSPLLALKCFSGCLEPEKEKAIFTNLLGFEFNLHCCEYLNQMGVTNIECEVPVFTTSGNTVIDITAHLDGNQLFNVVLPNQREVFLFAKKGEHSFEVKATKKLKKKALVQIKKAAGFYKNRHVMVLADTKVTKNMCEKIYDEGGDVVRVPMTKNDLVKRLLEIQRKIITNRNINEVNNIKFGKLTKYNRNII